MTTTAKLTALQERVLRAVGADWKSTPEVNKAIGANARNVLSALYTRGYIARQPIEEGRTALEWRLEDGDGVREVR